MANSALGTGALVFLGAGLGGNLRYWLGGWIASRYGVVFPWSTLAVNVAGSFAIGLFMFLSLRENWAPGWRLFVAVGMLGGFTTFSTFSYETLQLLEARSYLLAIGNAVLSLVLSLAACWLGAAGAKLLAGG